MSIARGWLIDGKVVYTRELYNREANNVIVLNSHPRIRHTKGVGKLITFPKKRGEIWTRWSN